MPMPKTVIADAGYGSEENYLYVVGEEKQPHFDFLIPYGSYMKEKTRRYKKDIRHASNWTYEEHDDRFICPNGQYVRFKKYQTKKNASGLEQSFKFMNVKIAVIVHSRQAAPRPRGTARYTGIRSGKN
ncbi:hypothetical protein [Paenibacillus thiaminolyticus]|uniref:hypothetical protein n=1 Tax=Paenibacillus thiaminolyticus TaxID=49283 RepID=UPI001FD14B67|nr:hypothetical protein [Paenibacillus thiaminolyticus]CAH8709532.1 hypothetical protein KYE0_001907 [Paenibacillus thiaminolyticus]